MTSDVPFAVFQSAIASAVFSAVMAGALAYGWRLYRQTYLAHWSAYWALYLVVWTADGLSNLAGLVADEPRWLALRTLMVLCAFAARAFFAVGVLHFLGRRLPTRGQTASLAGAALVLTGLNLGSHQLVAGGALPGWGALPFRTYAIGFLVSAPLAYLVLREKGAPAQRLLGLALAVTALSDAWDVLVEATGNSPWTASPASLYLSYFVVHLTDALFASGMLVAAIGTEHGRAERNAAELRRRDAALQEAQRQETIGQLAGGLAHDFNNLLTAVIGHLTLVRESLPPGSEAAQDADIATQAAERAAVLTRQLLTYARRQPSSPRTLDTNAVFASLDRMAGPLLGARVSRRLSLGAGTWPVRADPTQLEQLLVNLIVNARDAMPEGGTLLLETANETLTIGPRTGDAAGVPDGEWVRLTVEDDGEGMDEATRSRMFEPFFTTKPPGKGSGLGLAAAQGIVHEVSGHIGVRTAPGAGTRISVFLPRAAARSAPTPAPVPRATRGGAESILLVEDDPHVRGLAARTLEGRGYSLLTAADGEGALRLVDGNLAAVDLVLTDVVMPGMDGRELVRTLRGRRPGLRVLFMSGYASGAPGDLGGPLLGKPFTPDALAARVRDALDDPGETA